jgi:S1-C subfamily serine protease
MRLQVDILSGARAGAVLFFTGDAVSVGRHPESDLQFHPQRDLAVSTHHALLIRRGGGWFIRDLASRNGTFVNGVRVGGEVPVAASDRILFGAGGPEVEVRIVHFASPSVEVAMATAHGAPTRMDPPAPRRETTAERLRVQLARQARGFRWMAVGLSALLLVALVALFSVARRQQVGWERERMELQARVDSILGASNAALGAMAGEVEGLGEALEEARREVVGARDRLEAAESAPPSQARQPEEVSRLRRELQAATQALSRFQLAANFDFAAVEGESRRAVARLYVEMADGSVVTGTGFAVRSNATLVTNRHVVAGVGGGTARRVAVQFADSDQVWPARVVLTSPSVDLALVKVDNIEGAVPVVPGFNLRPDTLGVGTPLALLGFPLGGEVPVQVGTRPVVRPLLSAGILEESGPEEIVIQGYGARGASGSPVLDGSGRVVGVVFGGRGQGDGHRLLVVPAPAVRRLLDALPDPSGAGRDR